jgi:methionyl-tRNA formyltransferase
MPHISEHQVSVVLSETVGGKKSNKSKELLDLQLLEQDLVNQILFPLIEKSNQLSAKLLTFKQLEKKYNITIKTITNINADENIIFVKYFKPDILISIRHGIIFKNELISIPKYGVINLHSGILPHYRGVLATFRALNNGDETIGTTLHYIDDVFIDTGKIIGVSQLKVNKDKSLFWHIMNIYFEGVKLLAETINKIAQGVAIEAVSQLQGAGAYYSFPNEIEIEDFKRKGWKIFEKDEYLEFIKDYISPDT